MVLQFAVGSAAFLARKAIMKKIKAKKPNISQKALLAIATNATRVKFGDIVLKRKGKSKTKNKKNKNLPRKKLKSRANSALSKLITGSTKAICNKIATETENKIRERIG